jgi:hypothetical protein
MRGSRRSVCAHELLEQRGGTRFRIGELETDQVSIAAGHASDVTDASLERAEIVNRSEANGQLSIDVERPGRKHQRAAPAQVFNLDGRICCDGPG